MDGVRGTEATAPHDEFAALFAENHAALLRFAYLICGDRDRAEDAVAEAFARMYPHWKRGRVQTPGAYLRRAVVNEVHGRFRRLRLERREEARARIEPQTPTPADRAVAKDRVERLLAELSPRQRAVVVLRYLEDASEHQCAQTLGISPGAVKGYLSRALERMRALETEGAQR